MNGKRRRWTSSEKLRIVLAGLQGNDVAELCRREGLTGAAYYSWKKKLHSSAADIFDGNSGRVSVKEERAEAELTRMKGVVAEITAENLELKKGLSV